MQRREGQAGQGRADILDEVCKAVVAPASTHPHRQMEDAITKLASTRLRDHPTLPPLALPEEVCDMPEGPHNAGKERLLRNLAQAVSYHPDKDTRRHHYMKEGIIFLTRLTR
eukprot:s519_g19.t1